MIQSLIMISWAVFKAIVNYSGNTYPLLLYISITVPLHLCVALTCLANILLSELHCLVDKLYFEMNNNNNKLLLCLHYEQNKYLMEQTFYKSD